MLQANKIKQGNKFIEYPCPQCGKVRLVPSVAGVPRYELCHSCASKERGKRIRGRASASWKGGKHTTYEGYKMVWLSKDDFFWPMAQCKGKNETAYALEHRLVMAKHLGRNLRSWEVVHHKNSIRDDNRIENLELLPHSKWHLVDLRAKAHIKLLEKRIKILETQIAETPQEAR